MRKSTAFGLVLTLLLLLLAVLSVQAGTNTFTNANQVVLINPASLTNSPVQLQQMTAAIATNTTFSVLAFGAARNGVTDDTAAVQSALNSAATTASSNNVVTMPAGRYLINGPILVPPGVQISGFSTPSTPYNYPVNTSGMPSLGSGTILVITSTVNTVFTYNSGNRFTGLTFIYPNQLPTLTTPIVYPPTFNGTNNGLSIVDVGWEKCNFPNSYSAIVATNTHGPFEFYYLTLWTPHSGILEDNGGDSDNYDHVRFSSGYFAAQNTSLVLYGSTNAIAFQIGRSDGLCMDHCFVYDEGIALKTVLSVSDTVTNIPWGTIGSFEADACQYGWWCEAGLQITTMDFRGNDYLYDFYVPPGLPYTGTEIYFEGSIFDVGTQTNNFRIGSQMAMLSISGGKIRNLSAVGGSAAIRIDAASSALMVQSVFFNGTTIPITNTAQQAYIMLNNNIFNATNVLASPVTFRYRGNTKLSDASSSGD